MRTTIVAVSVLLMGAVAGLGTGCDKEKDDAEEKLAESVANSVVLGMVKDQYRTAKTKFDKGDDASGDCVIETTELRKDKSAEAQQLVKDVDRLCKVDVPARKEMTELDKALTNIQQSKTDKAWADMLPTRQSSLKLTCDQAGETLKDIATGGLSSEANAKALDAKKTQVCVADNLDAPAKATAANTAKAITPGPKKK